MNLPHASARLTLRQTLDLTVDWEMHLRQPGFAALGLSQEGWHHAHSATKGSEGAFVAGADAVGMCT